jgi:ferredoxin
MKIVVDQDACIGAASCVIIAAKTFALNQEGKVFILNESQTYTKRNEAGESIESETTSGMDLRETIIESAKSCPVFAIKLFEDDGTEIVL